MKAARAMMVEVGTNKTGWGDAVAIGEDQQL